MKVFVLVFLVLINSLDHAYVYNKYSLFNCYLVNSINDVKYVNDVNNAKFLIAETVLIV
jgi:hypothetical protein